MNTYDELFEQMDIIRKMHKNFRESSIKSDTIFDGRPLSNIMDVAECKETVDKSTIQQKHNSLIEYAKLHLSDLVPYNDPNYETRLQEMAEIYAVKYTEQ